MHILSPMEKSSVETNDISLNPVNKMSRDEVKIKCHDDIRSRYLREPRGSCHNLCKYGKKHEPEHDEKHITSRKFNANSIALEAVQNLVKRSTAIDSDTPKVVEQTIQNSLSRHRRTVSSPQVNLKEIKQKDVVFRKQSSSSMLQSNNQSAAHLSSKTNGSAMPVVPLNVRNPLARSKSQLNTSRSMNGRMNHEDKSLHDNEMSEVGETKLLMPQRSSISSTICVGGTLSLKARKSSYAQHAMLKNFGKAKDDRGDFKEKALKIIDPKIEVKGLKSQENLSKELSRHAFDSAVCDTSEPPSNGQIQRKYKCSVASKEEDKRWKRTPVAKQLAESSSTPYKLKFKKGKVIELRTPDSVVPRSLGLKRGKVVGENPSAEITKRSFRRKRDIGGSNEHNSKVQSAKLKKANLESKLDHLKYQDALGKKKIQALLNEMIEETANKLVEIRKSKVKALVGAFETVISFQETKPASVV